jgi:hypothetical protein
MPPAPRIPRLEPAFEVVPGRSIGPVALGMGQAEVDALGPARAPEIVAHFDAGGVCGRVAARVPTVDFDVPQFYLAGALLNGEKCAEVDALFESLGARLHRDHAFTEAASVGLVGVRWDRLESYTWIEVMPPRSGEARAGPLTRPASTFIEVVPGRSVGPAVVGMTRAVWDAIDERIGGLTVEFEAGRLVEIQVLVPWKAGEPPFFTLGGTVLNGLRAWEIDHVFADFGTVVRSYGGSNVTGAGIWGTKWENSDWFYHCIGVSAAT